MKIKIIFGCLFSFFILMLTPAIPALRVESIKNTVESAIIENKNNLNIQELKDKIREKLFLTSENLNTLGPLVAIILILFSIRIMDEEPLLSYLCFMCALNILLYCII